MPTANSEETLYLKEQRRFRRLEASLPVWLASAEDFDRPGASPWSLGYTRDISMGGSKVFVPTGEEEKWRAGQSRGVKCLLRFDIPGLSADEYVTGHVRHVARDQETGNCWLGVEFDDGAERARGEVMRAGLKSIKQRRGLQFGLIITLALVVLAGWMIKGLAGRVNELRTQMQRENRRLGILSRPSLLGTKAEGISSLFESQAVRQRIEQLQANMDRLNNPKYQQEAERQRDQELNELNLKNLKTVVGAQVTLGVAWPYGFAWPQVTRDLEEVLGRPIPSVVTFRDFKAGFPLIDCREARLRGKTLQITWEPWYYTNPNAVKMSDIARGKWDKYIDSWAVAARSFGGEVQLRFGHEFNGNWYPWSVPALKKNGQDAAVYVNAFRHVHDRFTRAGADNVRWIWCLNAESVPDEPWNSPLRAYPGDAYVDIVSIDGYNFGTALPNSRWQTFREVYTRPYSMVLRNANLTKKPLMIGEIGCATVGGDKAKWMLDMDKQLRGAFRKVSGVVWFEAAKEADWRMGSSPATLSAARKIWIQDHYRRGEP